MPYTTVQARARLLEEVGQAADQLALALACLGEAYEQLDETSADRLEAQLFASVQRAYGLLVRLHTEFARRHGAPERTFPAQAPGAPSQGAKAFIERAVVAAGQAAQMIAELQDSMLPIEVGDPTLRAALAEVRTLLGELPGRAREVVRTLGR